MRQHTVETADGGPLRVFSFGDGPGVVLVCGTNTVAPTYFLPDFDSAVQRGDVHRAVSILGKGISAKLSNSPLPDPVFYAMVRILAISTRKGRAWKSTVHSAVNELALLDAHRPPAERYAGISVPVLVLYGSDSDEFYAVIAQALSAQLLHGRCTAVAGADHGALDRALVG